MWLPDMYSLHCHIILGAPSVTHPSTPIDHPFYYGNSTTISCTVRVRPLLDNSAVTWYKDGNPGNIDGSYIPGGQQVLVTEMYGWGEGWRSDLTFDTVDDPTCDQVTLFDGSYTCEVDDGNGRQESNVVSSVINVTAECKYRPVYLHNLTMV